jgi:hypothetical protein
MMPIFSRLLLLEFISLEYCIITEDDFAKIFELFARLEEIHLLFCSYPEFVNPAKFPPQLKRLKIIGVGYELFMEMDLSLCTQLEYL